MTFIPDLENAIRLPYATKAREITAEEVSAMKLEVLRIMGQSSEARDPQEIVKEIAGSTRTEKAKAVSMAIHSLVEKRKVKVLSDLRLLPIDVNLP